MKFVVGTTNKAKLQAVSDALKHCHFPNNALLETETRHEVIGVSGVDSHVSPQPFSLNETRLGAYNRARGALDKYRSDNNNNNISNNNNATADADFGVGIEGGIEVVDEGLVFDTNNNNNNNNAKDVGAVHENTNLETAEKKVTSNKNNIKRTLFVVGWICVIHRETGTVGWGSSARMEIPPLFATKLQIKEDFSGTGTELAQVIDEVSKQHDLRSSLGVEGLLTNGGLDRGKVYEQAIVSAFAKFVSPREIWNV